ncbi:MAG: response regulator [Lachnospiraceae bacterium]|nr:response regulator [Lachnospiraceae bacterium]
MKKKILIVDDVELNRIMLEEMLQEKYDIFQAANGKEAIQCLEKENESISLILLDLLMPELDGFGVLEIIQKKEWMKKIPVMIISGDTSVETENRCFEYGISDFIHKPFDSSIIQNRVKNIIELFSYKNQLEEKIEKQTGILRKQNKVLMLQAEKLKENNIRIIDILGTVVESRNLESGEHINRVKGYTRILGNQLMQDYPEYGLAENDIEIISSAAALHDIGKIAIPDNILLKPGKLTDEEFECMKSHTTRGCEILNGIEGIWEDNYRKVSYDICRHHHERYDGKGYPDGLKGDDIPVAAQIVSVADVYDALVNERVYKDAFSCEDAFFMIVSGECGMFSPKLMESFRKSRKQFEELAGRRKEK